MTPDTAREITAAMVGSSITATLVIAAQIAFNDPDPAPTTTTTVTTTVTTPVAPCDGPACPPWPSLDY